MATTRRLKAILEAQDRASPVLGKTTNALRALGTVAAAVGAYQIGRTLVKGINDAVKASAEYEFSAIRLQTIIANQGGNVEKSKKDLLEFAKALTDVSLATENQIVSALAQAKALGATDKAAKDLTQAAVDLAVATGVEMETAFRQVNRTLGGYAGELGEVIPELKELTAEELRSGAAADILLEKFKGAGDEGAKTLQGSLNNLSSSFEQLQRAIGDQLLPVATAFINDFLLPMVRSTRDAANASSALQSVSLDLAEAMIPVLRSIETLATNLRFLKLAAEGMADPLREGWKLALAWKIGFDASSAATDRFARSIAELRKTMGGEITPDEEPIFDPEFILPSGLLDEHMRGLFASAVEMGIGELERMDVESELLRQIFDEEVPLAYTEQLNAQALAMQNLIELTMTLGEAQDDYGEHVKKVGEIERERAAMTRLALADTLNSLSILFGNNKALAIAAAIINTYEGATKALAQGGFLGIAMAASVIAFGLAQVKRIQETEPRFARGGIVSGPLPGDSVPARLTPGEMVLPKDISDFIIESARGGGSGGEIAIRLESDIPMLAEVMNSSVRSGRVRLLSSAVVSGRSTR